MCQNADKIITETENVENKDQNMTRNFFMSPVLFLNSYPGWEGLFLSYRFPNLKPCDGIEVNIKGS